MVIAMLTGLDVLRRAHEILTAGPLSNACAPYCPWCAIAKAKGQLDDEHGVGLDIAECVLYWDIDVESDRPLIEARRALASWNTVNIATLTQEASLEILEAAIQILNEKEENDGSDSYH